ncbi:hypothetical protein [Marinagarivorans algicola]|uniref:hypothetical protein n=1 Tax=Marinagarivorans algicola TaxID=1513270 RepID=UPI0012E15D81|nr:hypothetical protein [Marinagarivorans algicola]
MQTVMTSNKNILSIQKQHGDFLIESLVGVLLIGIIGVGITQIAGKITRSQADLAQQDLILAQLKSLVINGDPNLICNNAFMPVTYNPQGADNIQFDGSQACQQQSTKYKTITGMTIDGEAISAPAPVVVSATMPVKTHNNDTTQSVELRIGQRTHSL